MLKRNAFNSFHSFYNDNSNNTIDIKPKKSKIYFYNDRNNKSMNKTNSKLYLSYDTYNKNINSEKIEKICLHKEKCPYYKSSIEFEKKIKELISTIKKLKSLNEILSNSIDKQTVLYKSLINENKILKEELFYISSQKQFYYKYKNKRNGDLNYNSEERNKKKFNIDQFLSKEIKSLSRFSLKNIFNLKENSEEFKNIMSLNEKIIFNKKSKKDKHKNEILKDENLKVKSPFIKNILFNNTINNQSTKNHYNLIDEYNQTCLNLISDKKTRTLLSENIDEDALIQNNKILNKLILLIKTKKIFLSTLKNSSDDNYYKLYNMISIFIDEHKDLIKLGLKMKTYIKYIIKLFENMSKNNSIKILLQSICKILSCKSASIYLLDNLSDCLIEYSSEEKITKNINKNEGIIGSCFKENKKIRIDDEKNSILYYPISDKNGQCLGIIKAFNKEIPPFNNNDEEFAKLLSNQAGNILNYFNSNEDNRFLVKKLNDLIDYNISIYNINSKFDFTEKTEKILLNLFDCTISKYYFIENNKIIYYDYKINEKKEFEINTGIIGKVIKNKNIFISKTTENSPEYNSLVDIKVFDSILVIPILEHKTKIVKGIAQIPYIGTINKNNKPKDMEYKTIKKFRKCIKYWLYHQINNL